MGKGSRGRVAWRRARQVKAKKRKGNGMGKRGKGSRVLRGREFRKGKDSMENMPTPTHASHNDSGSPVGVRDTSRRGGGWGANEGGSFRFGLVELPDGEYVMGAVVGEGEKPRGPDGGNGKQKNASPGPSTSMARPDPGPAPPLNRKDSELLGELRDTLKLWAATCKEWGSWGMVAKKRAGELMGILGRLSHPDVAKLKKTAAMWCAEYGFLDGLKYLVEERGADTRKLVGRMGNVRGYAIYGRGRGVEGAASCIGYLNKLDEMGSQDNPPGVKYTTRFWESGRG